MKTIADAKYIKDYKNMPINVLLITSDSGKYIVKEKKIVNK